MNFIDEIIEAIKAAIVWYFNTELPQDTADCFARIITYANNQVIPLMWEYLDTIFGRQ